MVNWPFIDYCLVISVLTRYPLFALGYDFIMMEPKFWGFHPTAEPSKICIKYSIGDSKPFSKNYFKKQESFYLLQREIQMSEKYS